MTQITKTNNPVSAYALHLLNNKHEYGNIEQTIELLKLCNKGVKMNIFGIIPYTHPPKTKHINRRRGQ
jgi:hypothetical protein